MKRIIIAAFCLLILASCASTSTKNKKANDRKIAKAVYQEGKAYFAQKRYSIALGRFLEAEKIINDDRFLQYDLGFTYYIKKKYDIAELHFKKALELNPDFMPALNALGTMYLQQKKWDKAIESLEKCSASLLYPTIHYSYTNLGWAYFGKKDYTLAEDSFLKALEESPYYLSALHGFMSTSLETNSENAAIKKLNRAQKKFPNSVVINYDIASIYDHLGQYSKAKKYWEDVIRLAPEESAFYIDANIKLSEFD